MTDRKYAIIKSGRGSASAECFPEQLWPGGPMSSARVSGGSFLAMCREAVQAGNGECPAVDLLTCSDDDLYRLVVRGPMVGITTHSFAMPRDPISAMMIAGFVEQAPAVGVAVMQHAAGDRDPFEGYGSLDTVDVPTYCRIAERFGATVSTAEQVVLDAMRREGGA